MVTNPRDYSVAVSKIVEEMADASSKSHKALSDEAGIARTTLLRRLRHGSPLNMEEVAALANALHTTPAAISNAAQERTQGAAA